MARYDRIARLDSPDRGQAFTGWLAVRDLANQERDAELGRRARLRFLTVRLLHRLAGASNVDGPNASSVTLQADAVREELGQLPSRDAERDALGVMLKRSAEGDLKGLVSASFDLAELLYADGSPFAAEEFLRAATTLAEAHGLDSLAARGSRTLDRLEAVS